MDNKEFDLSDECLGQVLIAVHGYYLDYPDEAGPPMREGILLDCGEVKIVIQAQTETSELFVHKGSFTPDCEPADLKYYSERNLSEQEPFSQFLGKPLLNWWAMINERGYNDGFMVAFNYNAGLCFIAMNNTVSVLTVNGEQMS